MKSQLFCGIVLLLLTAFVFQSGVAIPATAQNPVVPVVRWEYKTTSDNNSIDIAAMNRLGDEGWELVSSETWRVSNQFSQIRHVFKRVRQ